MVEVVAAQAVVEVVVRVALVALEAQVVAQDRLQMVKVFTLDLVVVMDVLANQEILVNREEGKFEFL